MSRVTTYGEMQELAKEELYDDACTFLGGMNYTLETLDHLGSCAYDLVDAIENGEGDAVEGDRDFDDYVRAAEYFFGELDKVNVTYDELRQRVVDGIHEEYGKIKRLIEYRDDIVAEKVISVKDDVSVADYEKMWGYLNDSMASLTVASLDDEYDRVMEYLNTVDNGLRSFNGFGAMRDRYKTDLYDSDEIDRCDTRFYYQHEVYNPLIVFTYNVRKIANYVAEVKIILDDNYGIDLDAI